MGPEGRKGNPGRRSAPAGRLPSSHPRPAGKTKGTSRLPEAPPPFEIRRHLSLGNYPLSEVFRGFQEAPPFPKYPGGKQKVTALAAGTSVQLVADETWMYIAPHAPPPFAEAVGWKPFTSPNNCIVVGRKHLVESPSITLYLDIYHEFYHILQRHDGRELWDDAYDYVNSPTELEAYRFSIAEARRLGVPDSFLRTYLQVEWVSPTDHLQLLKSLGVTPSD